MYKLLQSIFKRLIIICLTACTIYSCSDFTIPEHLVEKHVRQILKEEIRNGFDLNITSSVPGEGDADTIYQYVKFNLVARYNQHSKLLGMPKDVSQGQILTDGEIVICYQRNHDSWKLIKYWVNKIPS